MVSVLLTKTSADQTELLAGKRASSGAVAESDEAASSFLTLEDTGAMGVEAMMTVPRGRRTRECTCDRRQGWARVAPPFAASLLGLLLLLAAAVITLEIVRSRTLAADRADIDALRREVDHLKNLAADIDKLKPLAVDVELYNNLRAFQDEVYAEDDDSEDNDEDEDDVDEDDVPPEDDDEEIDYYSDSEAVEDEVDARGDRSVDRRGDRSEDRREDNEAIAHHEHLLRPHKDLHKETLFWPHQHIASAKSVPTSPSASPVGPAGPGAASATSGEDGEDGEDGARHKREIAGISEGGVPVLNESYGAPVPAAVNSSEGLRLYGALAAVRAGDPTTASPLAKVYRERAAWGSKRSSKKEHRDTTAAAQRRAQPLRAAVPPVAEGAELASGGSATDPSAPGMISRESRVMQTATPAPRKPARPAVPPRLLFHTAAQSTEERPVQGKVIVRAFQGAEGPRTGGAALRSASGHRLKKKSPMKKTLSSLSLREAVEEGGAPGARGQGQGHPLRRRPVYAAHYGGDASGYTRGSEHYEGNGRLRHPTGVFSDWSASSWMSQLNMDKKFSLRAGEVTVTDVGLYFVYAQIYYLDEHDTNGFRVLVNGSPVLQCTVTAGHTGGDPRNFKSNTCFTAGALYLASGDRVSVREVGHLRWTVFDPEKSFFGLVKLGHTPRIT